jgi:hypothetical protein
MKGKLKITKFVYDAAFAKSSVYVVPVAQKLSLFSAKSQPNTTVKTNQHCTRKHQVIIIKPSIKKKKYSCRDTNPARNKIAILLEK